MRAEIEIRPNLIATAQKKNFEIFFTIPKTHLPTAFIGDVIERTQASPLRRTIRMFPPVQRAASDTAAAAGAPKVHAHGRISTDLNTPA